MKTTLLAASLSLSVLAPVFAAGATAQPAAGADNRAVVAEVRRLLAENYVVTETRQPLDTALAKALAAGRYDNASPEDLADRLNADMDRVAHDKHLGIHYDPAQAAKMPVGRRDDDDAPDPYWDRIARLNNQGVTELKVLDGNVRYINYKGFMWSGAKGADSAAAIDAAMAFLRGGDAIVIDLRDNGGGSPDAVRHLASYFVPAGATLVTFHLRQDKPTVSLAETSVAGGRIAARPVYVLTSGHTASAAEEFASHVAGFGFGALVGETTAGAAYRNEMYPVAKRYVLSVSIGRPELPKGGNWEAKGVAPKIAVPRDAALDAAQADALKTLAARASGDDREELTWLAAAAQARATPLAATTPLAAFAGRYGERSVRIDGDRLRYRRDGNAETAMLALGPDLYALDSDPRTHVRFVREGGAVTGFSLERLTGEKTLVKRS